MKAKKVRRAPRPKRPSNPYEIGDREVFSTDEHFRNAMSAYITSLRIEGKRFNKSGLYRELILDAIAARQAVRTLPEITKRMLDL